MIAPVGIISFGYLHGPPPAAHVTVDARDHFRDPHIDPCLRELTGAHLPVIDAVLATAGIPGLIGHLAGTVEAFLSGPQPGPVTVAVGCAGGRHRAPVIACQVAMRLRLSGTPVLLTHRDMGEPAIRHRRLSAQQVDAMIRAARADFLTVLDRVLDGEAGLADVCHRSQP